MRGAKRIALSGVSGAFSTLFLIVSVYIPLMDMSCMVLASLAILLPIAKNEYMGAFLAYISAALLGILVTGNIIKVLPYVIFFGLHPIIISLLHRFKVNIIVRYIIKLVFANLAIFLAYMFLGLIIELGEFTFPYYLIALVGSLGFLLYDWLVERLKFIFSFYIDKLVNKRGR